ncbi:MAG: phosphoglycerate kinase [Bdellovibrionaceae bacterium]|jgi:phosphoglycerate kinase|nr:phosphoglycerate kinase [Pseudobdellovibrionaceae bacterium]
MSSYLRGIRTLRDIDVSEKVVFLRLDLNVPIEKGVIQDLTRIQESLPTIKHLLEKKARIVIASHLGRPKSAEDKEFSLLPVGEKLAELLGVEVILTEDYSMDFMKPTLAGLTKKQVLLLENLRFYPGETKNDEELARAWAAWAQVYVNDAFGASHRAHASIDALPRLMPQRACGFLIEKELESLGRLMGHVDRPYIAILGGSKVSDKIEVIEKLIDRVDALLVGGAMAYTFLKAQGVDVGLSRVENDQLNYARELLKRFEARNKTVLLPLDHRVTKDIASQRVDLVTPDHRIPEGYLGIDIGPKTEKAFATAIAEAKTIFWNGPMGIFEVETFAAGTTAVAHALAENQKAFRVVGGGDSASAAQKAGITSQVNHVSTGGGASLEFLQGASLPGLEALRYRHG